MPEYIQVRHLSLDKCVKSKLSHVTFSRTLSKRSHMTGGRLIQCQFALIKYFGQSEIWSHMTEGCLIQGVAKAVSTVFFYRTFFPFSIETKNYGFSILQNLSYFLIWPCKTKIIKTIINLYLVLIFAFLKHLFIEEKS